MYIRTKNRIYKTESAFLDNNGKWVGYNIVEDDMAIILRSQVIREADTIEELCDEFVVECFNKSYHAISEIGYDELKHNTQTLSPTDTIYGAIWTSKGLIYVAKMNDKGELELI